MAGSPWFFNRVPPCLPLLFRLFRSFGTFIPRLCGQGCLLQVSAQVPALSLGRVLLGRLHFLALCACAAVAISGAMQLENGAQDRVH